MAENGNRSSDRAAPESVPCVAVAFEDGERTRTRLDEAGLLDRVHEIHGEDELYIPVTDAETATELGYTVEHRDPPRRETQTTPADLLAFDPSYERIGRAALVDEDDPERARELADAIVESDIPAEVVLNRASKIRGEQRVRDWELLAGEDTELLHREYDCAFALDIAEVYFSPRLATERHRVAEQVTAGEHAFDMFAGVGPFAIQFATRGATVVATDINEVAIEYCRENARRNGVAETVTAVHGDVRDLAPEYENWADRIVMNLPHSAEAFLDTALALAADEATLHYYDIQPAAEPFAAGETAIGEAAADAGYETTVETRHRVRSYAPHEDNVVLDVTLERG